MVRRTKVLLILAIFAWTSPAALGQKPAFSGAEGFGGQASASGLAGAEVYHVTNLNDSGPGSFRGAFQENSANKIIVFDVAGTIALDSKLDIKNLANYYIAGQSAPGPVTIYGDMTQLTHSNNKENRDVVLRYLTFRKGLGPSDDSVTFAGGGLGTNLILDHVSASWSEDEVLSVANNNTNVTVQYSIISDALGNGHNFGSLIRPRISSQVTFHHNLYANNRSRQPRLGTYNGELLVADIRNNVVYNWGDRATYAGGSSEDEREFVDVNYVGNYFVAGPATENNATRAFIVDRNVDVQAYQAGNFIDSDRQANPDGEPNGVDTAWGMWQVSNTNNPGTLAQMATPFDTPTVTTQSAIDAYWQVVNHAGNFWWDREEIDARVINNVLTNTGAVVNSPNDTELNNLLTAPTVTHPNGWDTDGDAMPDWWETEHGLNPDSAADWNLDFDDDGYTNLEEYLNDAGAFPAPAPIVFTGGTNNRYEQITNWKTSDGVTSGTHWQPSWFDEAQINSGTVTVDSVGQHAGLLVVGAHAGDNGHLQVTDGWLRVAEGVIVGDDPAAQGTLTLSGGLLSTPVLAKGDSGSFAFTGGKLQADVVAFDLENQGGTLALGNSIGQTHVMGDLALTSGSLQIDLASETLADFLLVDGQVTLGGSLDVELLEDFAPESGSWHILSAAGIIGTFDSITEGFSVEQQGSDLFLLVGSAPALAGDYNGDGIVDAADYTVWRDGLGAAFEQENYTIWKNNFGATSGSTGSASAHAVAPEPATMSLLLCLGLVCAGPAALTAKRFNPRARGSLRRRTFGQLVATDEHLKNGEFETHESMVILVGSCGIVQCAQGRLGPGDPRFLRCRRSGGGRHWWPRRNRLPRHEAR